MTTPILSEQDIAELEEAERKATKGPWNYRPHEYDDWGWIRGPKTDDERGDNFPGWTVCCARSGGPERPEDRDRHRVEGTDPYGHNAKLIATIRNAALPLIAAWREREELRTLLAQANETLIWIDDNYENPNMSHVDFRVAAKCRVVNLVSAIRKAKG